LLTISLYETAKFEFNYPHKNNQNQVSLIIRFWFPLADNVIKTGKISVSGNLSDNFPWQNIYAKNQNLLKNLFLSENYVLDYFKLFLLPQRNQAFCAFLKVTVRTSETIALLSSYL